MQVRPPGAIDSCFFVFLPIIGLVVVCPAGPHPALRLARRPNRGDTGSGLLRCPPLIFFSRGSHRLFLYFHLER